ncbi:hypothetical protein BD410DRAFT_741538 [Rickenella mellea]|uniref:F-box domain-containing protein n=1 Tax=Rickenella mellea TaxID=50990 RepID=A0A4Y7QIM6_9AGAM|nr:hypothetical protein BD410DRAFT_741538 [Rickenella mellea]
MAIQLSDLIDDILLIIIDYSSVSSILKLRETCRRFCDLTQLRSVWLKTCIKHVLDVKLPFPDGPLDSLTSAELESQTRHALEIQQAWTSRHPGPRKTLKFQANPSNFISDVHFVPRKNNRWMVTVSKGIWSVIVCWDLGRIKDNTPHKLGEWTCRGALILDVVVNTDPENKGCLAVALFQDNVYHRVEILSVTAAFESENHRVKFETIAILETADNAIALQGDIIAIGDPYHHAKIVNWKTGDAVTLRNSEVSEEDARPNRCVKILFCHEAVLVGRARSLDLFYPVRLSSPDEEPSIQRPNASHSFGWIDSMAIAPLVQVDQESSYPPISILLRAQSDDPWTPDIHTLKRYIIEPVADPAIEELALHRSDTSPGTDVPSDMSCPYSFPPVLADEIPSSRGFLRCAELALGPCGTALWIQPRPRPATGLAAWQAEHADGHVSRECLMGTVFPGPLRPHPDDSPPLGRRSIRLWVNEYAPWTSLDYCENTGRIALGCVDGQVMVLDMCSSNILQSK